MRRPLAAVCLATLLVTAGCSGLAGTGGTPSGTVRQTDSPTATPTPTPPDSDGDGLPDPRERELGTDPTDSDTDGDGLPDGREVELGADPTLADTDADELDDAREAALGTDPAAVDTDGDGFPDSVEVRANDSELPGADPLHKDVYVEVDAVAACSYDAVNRTVEAYADAPVSNPDGESGIDLHPVFDDRVPAKESPTKRVLDEYENEYRDRALSGYHYVVLVEDLYGGLNGFNGARDSIAECSGAVFMHELGHSLGLTKNIAGVDSNDVPFDDYPSAMNYNAPAGYFHYSTGDAGEEDFDDWSLIGDSLATTAPSTLTLRDRYLNGSIGRDDGGGLWETATETPANQSSR